MINNRFVARKWVIEDGCNHLIDTWGVFDSKDNDCIFGDNMPRDEREAMQCARAANIAYSNAVEDIKKAIMINLQFNLRNP